MSWYILAGIGGFGIGCVFGILLGYDMTENHYKYLFEEQLKIMESILKNM